MHMKQRSNNMSNNEENINPELLAAIAEFHKTCPPITKGGEGFIRKAYRYATLDDINRIINPLLASQGLFLTHNPTLDNTLISIIYHINGGRLAVSSAITIDQTQKNGAQAWGSALTYIKRYHTCAMLNLVTGDYDDDGRDADKEETPAELPLITADQLSRAIEWISVDPGSDKPLRRASAFMGKYTITLGDLETLRSHEIKERWVAKPFSEPAKEKPAEKPASEAGKKFPDWPDVPPAIRSVEGKWDAAVKWVREAPSPGETRRKATDILQRYGMSKEDLAYLESQEYTTPENYAQPEDPKEIPDPKRHPAAVPREAPEDSRRVLTEDMVIWSEVTAWLQRNPGAKVEQLDGKYIIGDDDRKKLRMYEAAKDSTGVIPF